MQKNQEQIMNQSQEKCRTDRQTDGWTDRQATVIL